MPGSSDQIAIESGVALRCRRARKARGLTQVQLAALADEEFRSREQDGESDLPHPRQGAVSALENGQRRADRAWVEWIVAFIEEVERDDTAYETPLRAFDDGRKFDAIAGEVALVTARQRTLVDAGLELVMSDDEPSELRVQLFLALLEAENIRFRGLSELLERSADRDG